MAQKVWQADPERIARSTMSDFQNYVASRSEQRLQTYAELYEWSIGSRGEFWRCVADFCGVIWHGDPGESLSEETGRMLATKWFPTARLNFAENLLRQRADDEELIVSHAEGREVQTLSAGELRAQVRCVAAYLREQGVVPGDRVAGVVANVPEAIVAMLASSSLGAVWSSCSPDFGEGGIVDRFAQIEPKILFYTSAYQYNGKVHDCRAVAKEVIGKLPSVKEAVFVDHLGAYDPGDGASWGDIVSRSDVPPLEFASLPFDHPLYILFSSGTTGVPKCIVHGAGGTLLQHLKELRLHSDIQKDDRLLFFTTCGWMMWNWMVSTLATPGRLALFEGSVGHPDLGELWRFVENASVSVLGTSPKYLGACLKAGVEPREVARIDKLRTVLSTGAPLLAEHFRWVYDKIGDVHLASISGGTDIVSCFMLGNPLRPVYEGQIQGPGLGMAVEAWDSDGKPVVGEQGELVCSRAFPSMPVGFWGDQSGERYRGAYFDQYDEEVWWHGDYVEVDPATGGITVLGRSDATLNPGGVRIGTAEIYRHVEALEEVKDSLAVGRPVGDDVEIVLFVQLADGVELSEDLQVSICKCLRRELTPRHVPAAIRAVGQIPYTRSGKKVEMAVKAILAGNPVKNVGALANPESLELYREIALELSSSPEEG